MELDKIKWNNKRYKEFIKYLKSLGNLKDKNFNEKLIKTKYEIIGIKIPILRSVTKSISKGDYIKFIDLIEHNYLEETIIHGLLLNEIKEDDVFYNYFEKFLPFIDNWATCDIFCSKNKKKYTDEYFDYYYNLSLDKREFYSRVGLITILANYLEEKYIDKVLDLINKTNSDYYYVNMARAWVLCDCYIKFKDKTNKFLLNNNIDKFTFNKAISKMCDSYRVSKEEKEYLKSIRRH